MTKLQTAPPRALERVDPFKADLAERFLMDHYEMKRPPIVAAKLLAYIVELYQGGEPFPPRKDVAERLNCTVFGVDAALSVALSRQLITIEIKTCEGNVQQRPSTIRERYYIPSKQLLSAVVPRRQAVAA